MQNPLFASILYRVAALTIGVASACAFTSCSDDEAPAPPALQPTLPNEGGARVVSIAHKGARVPSFDWQLVYTGDRLTRAEGTRRTPESATDRTYAYTSTLSYDARSVYVTNTAGENPVLTLGGQNYIDKMSVGEDEYYFSYTDGRITSWRKIDVESSMGQAQTYITSATLSYENGNLKQIVYTEPGNRQSVVTFTTSGTSNLNGLLPAGVSQYLGVLGFEHLYYAGLLGRAVVNLPASVRVQYPAGSGKGDYETTYTYATEGRNVTLCSFYTPEGDLAAVDYTYAR